MRRAGGVLVLLACVAVWPASAGAAKAPTRYSLAGGCYSLAPASGGGAIAGASQLRFKATDLGSYMLYGTGGDYLAASGGSVVRAAQPGPDTDWSLAGDGDGAFTLTPASQPGSVLVAGGGGLAMAAAGAAGESARFRFLPASGCAEYPEAELDVAGTPAKGKTPYGEVRGMIDGHMHWMPFEFLGGDFHCGRPWDRYGITKAMPDCATIEGPQGTAAPVQNFLNYGNPAAPHDTSGWPDFGSWAHGNYTYEGTYYRWVERAWAAGLRLIVMPAVENRELCQLLPRRRNPCDEMEAVRRQIRDVYALQDYVDAQAGGPGKGFFQVVRSPFEARRVINQGKMAVVLEVEVSELFDCRGSDPASCSPQVIDRGLDELYGLGVRSSLLLNKFDNPLSGVRFDSGELGLLINAANRDSYGSFWSAQTCQGPEHDNTLETMLPPASSLIYGVLATFGVGPGTLPAYPPAPHCNTRGLTELGRHTVRRMMDMGMIVNPDHMSQRGVDDTLTLAESRDYSGVISPHGWMDPRNWPRIWQLGGMAFPAAGSASGFVDAWLNYRPKATPYFFGWGYGADMGGLGTQGGPPASGSQVSYPFKSIDGSTTVQEQRAGNRTFDYNRDGVANYGLYADWSKEVSDDGGPKLTRDMLHGAEAYLEMWERSVGVPSSHCQSARAHLTKRGLGKLRLGLRDRPLLERAGQPLTRTRAWSWCVKGKRKRRAAATAVLTPRGKVALVASSARGHRALGIVPGDRAARLDGIARRIGGGIWVAKRFAFVVRKGVVRTVAVAGGPARGEAALRSYLRRVPGEVARRPATVTGAAPRGLSPERAVPLIAQRGAPQFPAFVCAL